MTEGHLSASALTILDVLRQHGILGLPDLRRETGLGRRTMFEALRRLQNDELVQRTTSMRDTRRAYFTMSTTQSTRSKIQPTIAANSNGAVRMSMTASATSDSVPAMVMGPKLAAMQEEGLRRQFFPSKAAAAGVLA